MSPDIELIEIKNFLSDPARWTKDAYARDKNGKQVSTDDETAYCFCLTGLLLNKQVSAKPCSAVLRALHKLEGSYINIPEFNDDVKTTHEDVLKLLDSAIEISTEQSWI